MGPPQVIEDLTTGAHADARRAAHAAGVVVRDVHDPQEARVVRQLLDGVWDGRAGSVFSVEALVAIAHAGGQVSVALREGEVVGATGAFLGRDERTGSVFLHSHVTGVRADTVGSGIGQALKWYQRAWCLERGIAEVRWTYDPLIRRNAVLNLLLLGAYASRYERDLYGPLTDARNAGLPTDRLVVSWELAGPLARAAASGGTVPPDVAVLLAAGAVRTLAVDGDRPVLRPSDAPYRLVQVPADIEALRARDQELAAAWASAVRTALADAMDAGARVTGVTRDGWYVLDARPDPQGRP